MTARRKFPLGEHERCSTPKPSRLTERSIRLQQPGRPRAVACLTGSGEMPRCDSIEPATLTEARPGLAAGTPAPALPGSLGWRLAPEARGRWRRRET